MSGAITANSEQPMHLVAARRSASLRANISPNDMKVAKKVASSIALEAGCTAVRPILKTVVKTTTNIPKTTADLAVDTCTKTTQVVAQETINKIIDSDRCDRCW